MSASSHVSREHCSIEQDGMDVTVRDLNSASGVFIDGSRVDSMRIEDGMEVVVGPALLKFIDSDV